MTDSSDRLRTFLTSKHQPFEIQQLTPDASTREYFRVAWKGKTAIACVYPEAFVSDEQSYLDVTNLFKKCGLPVAAVFDHNEDLGVIVLEDLGDRILRDAIVEADDGEREQLIDRAISLIPRIQAATVTGYNTNSIACKLKFDTEKLLWELDFFKTHYFTTFLKEPLSAEDNAALDAEFLILSRDLESRASVLCHRDFHAANLMIDLDGELRIIDHQDARIGSPAYDLVSLLLDRITEPPAAAWLSDKRRLFLSERTRMGLPPIDENVFADEFRLQTIQRCLKAVGTFSFQSSTRGKTYFVPFIKPMFQIAHRAASNLDRFPVLQSVLAGVLAHP